MSTVLVRYETKPERADENQALVEAVFAQLQAEQPDGLRYMTLRFGETQFAHVAEIEGEMNPLRESSAFAEFQREIADRCVEGPNPVDVQIVGQYRFAD